MTAQSLLRDLAPVLDLVATLPLADCRDDEAAARVAAQLQQALPADGPLALALGAALRQGIADGWLCDRGEPNARFSRIAKAGPDTRALSIDVVALEGPALRHGHPQGEVTLALPADPAATAFCGRRPRPRRNSERYGPLKGPGTAWRSGVQTKQSTGRAGSGRSPAMKMDASRFSERCVL
jgi:hypothetical protein